MKPPHYLCVECGTIYVQGNPPRECYNCSNSLFVDLGYEKDYEKEELDLEFQEWKSSVEVDPDIFWSKYRIIDSRK
ncbi:MAG: hypothetical protein GF383_07260 [Candidatus Lokiarchaeota archaeon]|nr:hypothetical protein [Candidatus Lokiarchaeota archaeon]MBD3339966.1 hypothetical protein [Candidatus Lokiarchaeota archaeon]